MARSPFRLARALRAGFVWVAACDRSLVGGRRRLSATCTGQSMRIETDIKLDFKDVLIRPKRSTLNTRSAVDVDRALPFPPHRRGVEGLSAHRRQHGRDRNHGDGARARQARGADRPAQALSRSRSLPSSSPGQTARMPSIRSARPRPTSRSSPRSPRRRRSGSSVSTSPTATRRSFSKRSSACATITRTPSSWPATSSPAT